MFFEFIILGLALANAIVAPLTYWKIMNWWDFYIPIVIFIGTYIIALLLVMLFLQIMAWQEWESSAMRLILRVRVWNVD